MMPSGGEGGQACGLLAYGHCLVAGRSWKEARVFEVSTVGTVGVIIAINLVPGWRFMPWPALSVGIGGLTAGEPSVGAVPSALFLGAFRDTP